ncbi:hypothetical protein DEFDS_0900 [Deferribacter desulfuricans SSM1]|uniref:Tyr recombinase domain-containing protein n=1 Tax=Deferribacter desulfuricans (strain DSM 14783 / JCM 11476 / NBRC 101012 / SSM1) TaxID=639282 RepID=D3PCQ1_DEFDS|nr:site-specific integrase [Deferribacter desulfuricans]BAI80374.1 hypothetical protein DEFDS_0900 [Deferribacter desulfuricans SSM1]
MRGIREIKTFYLRCTKCKKYVVLENVKLSKKSGQIFCPNCNSVLNDKVYIKNNKKFLNVSREYNIYYSDIKTKVKREQILKEINHLLRNKKEKQQITLIDFFFQHAPLIKPTGDYIDLYRLTHFVYYLLTVKYKNKLNLLMSELKESDIDDFLSFIENYEFKIERKNKESLLEKLLNIRRINNEFFVSEPINASNKNFFITLIKNHISYQPRKKQLAKNTIDKYINVIRSFLNNAKTHNYIEEKLYTHVYDNIKMSNKYKPRIIFLEEDEIHKLIASLKLSGAEEVYLKTLIAIETGWRRGDINKLTVKDIDFVNKIITTTISKTGDKLDSKPITEFTLNEIREYITKNNITDQLFKTRNNSKALKTAAKNAGIDKNVTMYVFRHTVATLLALSKDFYQKEIQEYMNHSKPDITNNYVKIAQAKFDNKIDSFKKSLFEPMLKSIDKNE